MSEIPVLKPGLLFDEDWRSDTSLSDACEGFSSDFPNAVIPARDTERFLSSKENIARLALSRYESEPDLSSFSSAMDEEIDRRSKTYHLPGNRHLPGPEESIISTSVNLDRAVSYASLASGAAAGVLLSGSVAWGSFFAPTIKSDADMLVACNSTDDMGNIVEEYSSSGLIKEHERKRFEVFQKLNQESKADIFSLRSFETGGECSLHFAETETLRKVAGQGTAGFTIVEGGAEFKALHDFRPNTSANARKQGGYVLRIVDGEPKDYLRFHPGNEAVRENGKLIGYLSESPISGRKRDSERMYAMGVIPFFLSICPVIITEQDSRMTEIVNSMQHKIVGSMNGKTVLNIPRGEIMPSHTLRHIQNLLSSLNGQKQQ